MKNLKQNPKIKTLILTHGDSDGICAGAIARSAFPDSYVYFTSPVNLLEKLNYAWAFERLIICDLAIEERNCKQLYSSLKTFAEKRKLYYIDHHPLPACCPTFDWLYHDAGVCASELTYRTFEPLLSRELKRLAIYGAIGDYCESTPHIEKWLKDWDKRGLYFQAGTLIQAILRAGRNYRFKRELLEPLSKDVIPSKIPGLLELARKAALNEEELRLLVKKNVSLLPNSAYVLNTNNSLSKAALYAASCGGKLVGIAAEYREKKKVYDLSLRARGPVDINKILREIAPKYGGSGGGHPFAAGARLPKNKLKSFLHTFDREIGKTRGKTR
ncbi:MAG: DHHA1 domain-containing protein [Methanosarcinaceae archaeon]|nr:DHHA1 domain-containing protein [Methanosarcinaceae archaeon]MDD4748780.1 DHHA1 domain-containing protein [Methanosarcinaceae archaeon]